MEETPDMFFGHEVYCDTTQAPRGDDLVKVCFNNYVREYRKRYLEQYTEDQILEAATEQWEKMSLIHQFQYYSNVEDPMDSTGPEHMINMENMEFERSAPTDKCCPKKRKPKCRKPKRCGGKPKPKLTCPVKRSSCAKPCPKMKPVCPKSRPSCPTRSCPKPLCPKPSCRKPCSPKPCCPKPSCAKPSCPKPSCPKPSCQR
ncbi:histone-like protein 18C [Drosophila subpulchrella]|uniref:histone-like protein 18C n=1 Tax=Drosophila subpulchrella TaxID=1486046 RepID=UPI0018A19E49|nr:histone-like protein 18C [Drosophila subpulchrella]